MAAAILIATVSTQPVLLLGASFLQMGDEFEFGARGLGVLTGLFFVTASVSSAPLGRTIQRMGWQRAMRVNVAASMAVTMAIALFARSTATLAALLVLGGVAYGLANPAANQALADHVDPHRRGIVFGLKHAGIPSSALVAGLAVPAVIVTLGWRWAYALATLLGAVVLLAIPRGDVPPTSHHFEPDLRRRVAPLTPPLLAGLAVTSSFATWGAIALSTYLVAASVDVGFSQSAGGLLLFAGSVTSIASRVLNGAYVDRIGSSGFTTMATLIGAGAAVFAGLAFATGWPFAALVIAGFATGWAWPGLMTFTVVNANAGTAAASSSITQAGIFLGAGAGPVVLGWVIDAGGFGAGWLAVAGALGLATIGVVLVRRRALAVPV
jgi:predicted MFS family arabinose efflux permease